MSAVYAKSVFLSTCLSCKEIWCTIQYRMCENGLTDRANFQIRGYTGPLLHWVMGAKFR